MTPAWVCESAPSRCRPGPPALTNVPQLPQLCSLNSSFVFVVVRRNFILAAATSEETADLRVRGQRFLYSLGTGGCYGIHTHTHTHTHTHSLLVAKRHSRGSGLAIKRARVAFWGKQLGRGVILASCAQVVGLKRVCVCVCVCVCLKMTFMVRTLLVNSS